MFKKPQLLEENKQAGPLANTYEFGASNLSGPLNEKMLQNAGFKQAAF